MCHVLGVSASAYYEWQREQESSHARKDAERLPELVAPLLRAEADYAKGNRFRDLAALARMPPLRRAGNMALSFLVKAATGYWHCFDPTNGFVAIRGEVLAALPLERVDRSYYFETSMLEHLYVLGAVVRDVPESAATSGAYVLQAGSYRKFEDADRVRAQLALQGIESNVQRVAIDNDTWHRVRIGPISDPAELERVRSRLKEAEVDFLVVRVGD